MVASFPGTGQLSWDYGAFLKPAENSQSNGIVKYCTNTRVCAIAAKTNTLGIGKCI